MLQLLRTQWHWCVSVGLAFVAIITTALDVDSPWGLAIAIGSLYAPIVEFDRKVRDSSQQVACVRRELRKVTGVTGAATQELNGVLGELSAIRDTVRRDAAVIRAIGSVLNGAGAVMTDQPSVLIKTMARRSLITLFTKHYRKLVEGLNSFNNEHADFVDFDSRTLAEISTSELVNLLPPGSVWWGTTRVASAAWKGDALKDYLAHSREKTRNQKLRMYRIYVVNEEDAGDALRDQVAKDEDAKISVRRAHSADVPDITLVWQPKERSEPDADCATAPNGDPTTSNMDTHYDPVGLLEFDVRGGRVVRVSLYTAESAKFKDYCATFRMAWREATGFTWL